MNSDVGYLLFKSNMNVNVNWRFFYELWAFASPNIPRRDGQDELIYVAGYLLEAGYPSQYTHLYCYLGWAKKLCLFSLQ